MKLPVIYRAPVSEADLNFILGNFLKHYRNADAVSWIPNDRYFPKQRAKIIKLMQNYRTDLICDPDDETHLLGFVISQPPNILHGLFIAQTYRNMGLAKQVLQDIFPNFGQTPTILTHVDKVLLHIVKNKFYPQTSQDEFLIKRSSAFIKKSKKYQLIYDPFLAESTP